MSEGPFCTHQTVRLTPHIHEDGSRTDHWRCECGQAFMPLVAPIDQIDAEAERLLRVNAEQRAAIRLLVVSLSECVELLGHNGVDGDNAPTVRRAEALLAQTDEGSR